MPSALQWNRKTMWMKFLRGFASGAGATLVFVAAIVVLLQRQGSLSIDIHRWEALQHSLNWLIDNLGLSLFAFALLVLWYIFSLLKLHRLLKDAAGSVLVQQAEARIDTIVALVFGVGVIWTAVGMRGALMYALGDGAAAVDQSAAVVLNRLVSGGMLIALSSTIAGGVLGYAMRVIKQFVAGVGLAAHYQRAQDAQLQKLAGYLAESIVCRQAGLASGSASGSEIPNAPARVS